MIKIDDQQIEVATKAIQVSASFKDQTPFSATANGIAEFIKALTKPQRKHLAEEVGMVVFDWVAFDPLDETTYPPEDDKEYIVQIMGVSNTNVLWWDREQKSFISSEMVKSRGKLVKKELCHPVLAWCEMPTSINSVLNKGIQDES